MEDEEIKKSYYSITPASVRYCKELGGGDAKHLYGEITALCNEKGYCWASNKYFADLYDVDVRSVTRWIGLLVKYNFVYVDMTSGKRKIFLTEKMQSPVEYKEEKTKKQTKKKKEEKTKIIKYSPEDLMLAELLLSKILYNFPVYENKTVNITSWAEDIRKLREIDKATVEQINFMINWIHGGVVKAEGKKDRVFNQHEFWSANIMSAHKLRKQWFENLVPKLQEALKKDIKKSTVAQL